MAEPKQERAVKKRELILRAAAEVFLEEGFHGASIDKISRRAGVTHGGMYFHFQSKRGLAQAVLGSRPKCLQPPPGVSGLRSLISLTFHYAREMETNVLLRACIRLSIDQRGLEEPGPSPLRQWGDELQRHLRAARTAGELLPGVDEREVAANFVGTYSSAHLYADIAPEAAGLPQRVAAWWGFMLPAIATPGTRAALRDHVETQALAG